MIVSAHLDDTVRIVHDAAGGFSITTTAAQWIAWKRERDELLEACKKAWRALDAIDCQDEDAGVQARKALDDLTDLVLKYEKASCIPPMPGV